MTRRKKRRRAGTSGMRSVALGFAFLVVSPVLFCQVSGQQSPVAPPPGQMHLPPDTRVIQGTVLDAHGAPISGAIVLLKNTKTLQIRSYIANSQGQYQFYGLSTDVNYEVRAETSSMTSPSKLVSVFDSKKVTKIDLKVKNKKKNS